MQPETKSASTTVPSSWREFPAAQPVDWPDEVAAAAAIRTLEARPPLIFAGEARALKAQLARVAQGKAFVLQAGDCAESFEGVGADRIRDQLRLMLQMSLILSYGTGTPVVNVARMAGQYAKPRTVLHEDIDGVNAPAFRGHILNGEARNLEDRRLDPRRMVRAYETSAATLNLLRAFVSGGLADLSQLRSWNRDFIAASPQGVRYEHLADEIDRCMRFMVAAGFDRIGANATQVWTSHEALLLDYEAPLTRIDSTTGEPYGCSAHMLWIGERTRQLDGAHVEFARNVKNPIGVKIGPDATPSEVVDLCERLNPDREPGRLTLISRLGRECASSHLPPLLTAVEHAHHPVVWICDPMHGNTKVTHGGVKTRAFEDIEAEIRAFFSAHHAVGTWPGGIHLEMTAEDVTECVGGVDDLTNLDLARAYSTLCDPRLNGRQSLDLVFRVADLISQASN